MQKYSLADIDQDILNQRWNKHKRSLRRSDTARKKQERMYAADHSGYMQMPYYVKREVYTHKYECIFIPERTVEHKRFIINASTGAYEIKIIGVETVPAHWSRCHRGCKIHEIEPYLKQYDRTTARATYKHLAVRKERHADYDEAPSAHSYYKRVAEVDWLAW